MNRYRNPQKRAAFAQLLAAVQRLSNVELNDYGSVDYDHAQRDLNAIAIAHGLAGNDVRDVVGRARTVERGRRRKYTGGAIDEIRKHLTGKTSTAGKRHRLVSAPDRR